jgi:L-2-hydroxycarboxylate dehydrogenase (NAD+)
MNFTCSELHSGVTRIFESAGFNPKDSIIIADVLLAAEKRGIPSHGIIRIKDYLGLLAKGKLNPTPSIRIVYETPSTYVIDGDCGAGMIVAKFAMEKVIEKASTSYTAWAAVRNSNHFGIAGYYSMMAAVHDMIGISMTNANPLVAPTFSTDRLLGTNPIAVAVPAGEEPDFVADFATTPIARGKLELLEKMNRKVSDLMVQDKNGNPSDEPAILKDGGAILPLGGDREHGSHKGFCMSAIVDIFSAVFSGAGFGPFVPPQVAYLQPVKDAPGIGLGHFFGAMRIDAFQAAGEFKSYMDCWIKTFRKAQTIEGIDQLIIPGDPEREKEQLSEKEGIEINETLMHELMDSLKKLGIPSPF